MIEEKIIIPLGQCGSSPSDDAAAAERRRKLKEALLNPSSNVQVANGQIVTSADKQPGSGAFPSDKAAPAIRVPEGKLAI